MFNKTKHLIITLISLLFVSTVSAEYDDALAKSLGADDYGMKSYVMVILTTGDKVIENKTLLNKAFAGHFENMGKLAEKKLLVVAGPFSEAKPKRGLFILNVEDLAEAEELVKTDPAVQAGVFNYELYKLYSSAALMLVNENHKKIQKVAM